MLLRSQEQAFLVKGTKKPNMLFAPKMASLGPQLHKLENLLSARYFKTYLCIGEIKHFFSDYKLLF